VIITSIPSQIDQANWSSVLKNVLRMFRRALSEHHHFWIWPPLPLLAAAAMRLPFAIEILGATLEEACMKKRENIFQLIFTLFCEVERGFVNR
jgi:hypothetical protein